VLWGREGGRDAHVVVVLEARKARGGCWVQCGIMRANERVLVLVEDMSGFAIV
jgi:hypothetical protein